MGPAGGVGGRPGKGDSGVNPSRRSAGCQQHIPHKRDKHNANEMPSAAEKLNVVVVGGASSVFDALFAALLAGRLTGTAFLAWPAQLALPALPLQSPSGSTTCWCSSSPGSRRVSAECPLVTFAPPPKLTPRATSPRRKKSALRSTSVQTRPRSLSSGDSAWRSSTVPRSTLCVSTCSALLRRGHGRAALRG